MDIVGELQQHWWHIPIIIGIVLFYAILLNAVLFRPITNVLDRRKSRIKEAAELSDSSREELDSRFAEYEQAVLEGRRKANRVKETARSEAMAHRDSLLQEVRSELKAETDKADAAVEKDLQEARNDLGKAVADLANQAAAKILDREVAS